MMMMIMGCARKVALSVSFLCLLLLLLVSLADFNFGTSNTNNTIIPIPSTKNIPFFKIMHTSKKRSLNLNFVSKRRVPNGPDPIHNRRVGTTRLPPR